MAVVAILNRIKSSRRNDRHRPRRQKLWRGRRKDYQSRPQFRRPVRESRSAQEAAPTNDISTTIDTNANVDTTDRESLRDNAVEIEQPPTPSPSGNNLTVENSNCNVSVNENNTSTAGGAGISTEDLPTPSINSVRAEHVTDAPKNGNSSREVVSDKSRSDKCLEAVSGVTEDSGYTENSINSMKSDLVEDRSTSNHSNYTVSTSELTSLNDIKKVAYDDDDDDDIATNANVYSNCKQNIPLLNLDVPCFSLTGVVFDDCTVDVDGHQETDDNCDDNSSSDSLEHNTPSMGTSSNTEDKTTKSATNDDIDELEALYERAQIRGIALEDVKCTHDGTAAVGTVLVRNECHEKHVGARHSSNSWASYHDTAAEWVETIEGGDFDRFKFNVNLPQGRYHMELAFFCNQYWDNNNEKNHIISCTIFEA